MTNLPNIRLYPRRPADFVTGKAVRAVEGEQLRDALAEIARLEKLIANMLAAVAELREVIADDNLNRALAAALGARHKELRAKRGQTEFYAETLRGLGADPYALWVEALADDSTGYRKRFKPDEGDVSKS